ncbi:hypothetical protein QBC35DRAFT_378294 [Podospora australis]|uniref:Uncharacterized protein n=1 Tax=Podospora australis TaxID=1536484 RepID=A0AAN7AIW1_9PEZI|nr:hypothetical protein QBC35DRAFT_378294 [Podospora australis]
MSGGYSKFRCKYFLTHDCPNWVFMNGHACAACLAEGREAPESVQPATNNNSWSRPTEICVPQAFHGNLHYTIMEVVPAVEPGTYWTLRQKSLGPQLPVHNMTTSDTPRPAMVTTGIPMQMRRY